MASSEVLSALETLSGAVDGNEAAYLQLCEAFRTGRSDSPHIGTLNKGLPTLTRSASGVAQIGQVLEKGAGSALLAWLSAHASRSDIRFAPLLSKMAKQTHLKNELAQAARARVLSGPLGDALPCLAYAEWSKWGAQSSTRALVGRTQLLILEAAEQAQTVPEIGEVLFSDASLVADWVAKGARGSMLSRLVSASLLELAARSFPADPDEQVLADTMMALQGLLIHPDASVWMHAARALGRITTRLTALEGMLLDWISSPSALLRRRATTAITSQPSERLRMIARQLESVLIGAEADPWQLAAASLSAPYLMFEHRELWDKISGAILDNLTPPVARSFAQGLTALWRRGVRGPSVEDPLRQVRQAAKEAETDNVSDWQLWHETLSMTDALDEAERDPLDLERGLDNLLRRSAQVRDVDLADRASRVAESVLPTFKTIMELLPKESEPRRRASLISAFEGIGRSISLSLWTPISDANASTPPDRIQVDSTPISDSIRELLSFEQPDFPLHRSTLRVAGYLLDAPAGAAQGTQNQHAALARTLCGSLGRVPWLLAQNSRHERFDKSIGEIVYRLVDGGCGGGLLLSDDKSWLGPYAVWWCLVVDRAKLLRTLDRAMPMVDPSAVEHCCEEADSLRELLSQEKAFNGSFRQGALSCLRNLGAVDCELGRSILDLGAALALFSTANGTHDDLSLCAHQLAHETERIRNAMDEPSLALAEAATSLKFAEADSIAEQIESAIKTRDTTSLAVWFRKLGPVIGPLVERACDQAVRRTPPPRKKTTPGMPLNAVPMVAGYELVRTLGEGGMGTVWLVRRPGGARCFVMKLPHKDALAKANDFERQAILSSFEEEARVLTSLYHPNVASIIDSGIYAGLPFLVLEYLIGADMRNYVRAKLLTLQELKPIVTEACAGLASLHERGLVHRDIKPANIWLRLPLFENTTFDPVLHRDPVKTPVLATVVIDFGLVRAFNIETGGRVVAGTAGYIAPEQVFDPIDLDGRADTYSMAATVFHAMTGRSFFDDISDEAQRYLAHAGREPFDVSERTQGLPPALVDLLRRATCKDPTRRLDVLEFARQFAAI